MADDDAFEQFVRGTPAPAAAPPVTSGAGADEFEAFVKGGVAAPSNAALSPEFANFVKNPEPPKGILGTLGSAFGRGVQELENVPSVIGALGSAALGDTEGARAAMKGVQDATAKTGEAEWSLGKIHSPSDFGYWLTEKLGETAPAALTAIASGGVGAFAATGLAESLVSRGVLSEGGASALKWIGSVAPMELANTAFMTSAEAEKQFVQTGDVNPALALGAGAAEGALQTLVPMQVSRALLNPALPFAKSTLGGVVKLATEQGAAGVAQELISQAASAYNDPNYTFFGNGPWYDGPGPKALLEAGATGGAVGAVFGAPFARAHATAQQRLIDPETGEPLEKPGTRTEYHVPSNVNELLGEPVGRDLHPSVDKTPNLDKLSGESIELGPISEARRAVLRDELSDLTGKTVASAPRDDFMGIRSQIEPVLRHGDLHNQALDHLDATVPRYIEVFPDGRLDNRVMTDTELELANVTRRPQSEKPTFIKIDPNGSLTPASMTATLNDLAPPGSERIWFMDTTSDTKKAELNARYAAAYPHFVQAEALSLANRETSVNYTDAFMAYYKKLLDEGLRILPSRGSGFYYTAPGRLSGTLVTDITKTGRSTHVGWFNPETRVLTPLRETVAIHGQDSILSTNYGDGYPVSLDLNRIEPEAIQKNRDGTITLLRDPRIGELVPGQSRLNIGSANYRELFTTKPKFRPQGKVWVERVTNAERGKALTDIAQRAQPVISKILRNVGIPYDIDIGVTDSTEHTKYGSAALAYLENGTILLLSDSVHSQAAFLGTDLEKRVLQVLMHETGHFVTWHFYSKVPVEVQEQLHYAFNKALLGFRMDERSVRSGLMGIAAQPDARYHLSFTEWLAEQFRRWAISDERPVSELEKMFSGISSKLETFYKSWERELGQKGVLDLSRPDYHFSAFMNYLHGIGDNSRAITQLIKQRALYSIGPDIAESPVTRRIAMHVRAAVESMADMVPEPVRIQLSRSLDPGIVPGQFLPVYGPAVGRWIRNARLIELAAHALKPESAFNESRVNIAHELVHVYEDMGLFTQAEKRLLYRDIDAGADPAPAGLKSQLHQQLIARFPNFMTTKTGSREEALARRREFDNLVNTLHRGEQLAYYMQEYADTKVARSAEAKGVFDRIATFMERLGNYLRGDGFQTREDVINRFFNGEMVNRERNWQQEINEIRRQSIRQEMYWQSRQSLGREQEYDERPDRVEHVPGYRIETIETDKYAGRGGNPAQIAYNFIDDNTKAHVGTIELADRGEKGYEITWVEVKKTDPRLASMMLAHAEKDLGMRVLISGQLSEQGYLAARAISRMRGQRDLMDLYQKVAFKGSDWWMSPHFLKQQYNIWLELVKNPQLRKTYFYRELTQREAIEGLTKYKVLLEKLPKNVWDDPRLTQMFSLGRNNDRDEVQGSLARAGARTSDNEMLASIGSREPLAGTRDVFAGRLEGLQEQSQIENAQRYGLPVDQAAPDQAFSLGVRKTWEWLGHGGKGSTGNKPSVDKFLANQKHEPDRIGWFTRIYWTLGQLTWRNEHIKGLVQYLQLHELMHLMSNTWMKRADERARDWNRIKSEPGGAGQMEAISKSLFNLTEMAYRLPAEVAAKITRLPMNWADFLAGRPVVPGSELDRLFKAAGLKNPKAIDIVRKVAGDFLDFLNEVERVRGQLLTRTLGSSPTQLAAAQLKLKAEMNELRNKPYFPMVRFGEFTVTVRDPATRKVLGHWAYETQRQRDAAVEDIAKAHPGTDMTIGRIAATDHDFMSLPGPLLRALKEKLFDRTGKTPEQLKLIDDQLIAMEEFEMTNAPDRTFRKRWMPTTSLPGYSTDAFRAYAHYFMSGSRYLSRLAHMDLMGDAIRDVNKSVLSGQLGNTAKRQMIVKYMNDHFHYMMEPGKDSGKLRAFASLWFLGFSPVAAFTNLLQVPQVFFPTIAGHFGTVEATKTFARVLDGIKLTAGKAVGDRTFTLAREEAQRRGIINIGQAPELGAFAEGHNLLKLMAGTGAEKFWRGASYWGMQAFQLAEQFNREVSFKTAWDLANKNPNIKRMLEIELRYPLEINDLKARLGMTQAQAAAFLFSKEMVNNTQFQYTKYNDAPFQRGALAKNLTIFLKYTQSMTFAYRFNGAMLHFFLINLALFGMQSAIPGAEDINEVVSALGRKLFGQDWDLLSKVREYAAAVTKGTVFDRTGPWVALHGISHFGFGMGLLPAGMGAPRFDASANGSIGRIVPGLADLAHGLANDQKTQDIIANAAQKTSGAGYGLAFSLFNYLTASPGTTDSKKWEALLPRFVHAMVRAYRYGIDPGAETTAKGAKIAKFDASDPDDVATVITQALGFNATKVTEKWEQLRDVQDTKQVYDAQRLALYAQVDKAIRSGDKGALSDVLKAVKDYNEGVRGIDPAMQIEASKLRQSMIQRMKSRMFMETTGSADKRSLAIANRLKDLYPGVDVREVK